MAALALPALAVDAVSSHEPLQLRINEGRLINGLLQDGPVAAHIVLRNGTKPRLLVAFPAGNSGAGVWFEPSQAPVHWTLDTLQSLSRADARGRILHGVVAEVSVDAPLVIRDAVLGSVRVLRDFELLGTYPPLVRSPVLLARQTVEWARSRLDGAPGYFLSITVRNGEIHGGDSSSPLTLAPATSGGTLHLQVVALTGETPLTPLGADRLFGPGASDDQRSRDVLTFLGYEEKYLAGSWRFDTYFGRDTLISLRLLLPALTPKALESGLRSVLQRLAPNGEVAHEEDIGEFAILRHRDPGDPPDDAPIYDYKMIDDDFLLAPLAAAFLLDQPAGRAQAQEILARKLQGGEAAGAALVRNFSFVVHSASVFAQAPQAVNLIALKTGFNVGQWRDSEHGLADGRYAYDVNAVLVPAALDAIARFMASGLLDPWLAPGERTQLASAREAAAIWLREAPGFFRTRVPAETARRKVIAYAKRTGVSASAALESLPSGDLVVNALSLDASGRPIPVVHSDAGFALLLQDPPAGELEMLIRGMMRPFPAGLMTDAGLLVANPAFADAARQQELGRTAYHGTVSWSWQQALFAAGLERQLARRDLPPRTLSALRAAQAKLWRVIAATHDLRTSELWSWRYEGGRFVPVPFGESAGDEDESNAAQLWSTVYLAIRPPARAPRPVKAR